MKVLETTVARNGGEVIVGQKVRTARGRSLASLKLISKRGRKVLVEITIVQEDSATLRLTHARAPMLLDAVTAQALRDALSPEARHA